MQIKKKIKVLVVDDSLLFREAISQGLSADPDVEVVATAHDVYNARDKIIKYQPDVMTLDVEMPKMNGIEFLRRLMPQYPMPVVVVSSVSENVFEALQAGAVDFVTKPDWKTGRRFDTLLNELIIKVKIAATARVGHWKRETSSDSIKRTDSSYGMDIIAIGASTGGTEAIASILKAFPADMPGTVIVQHMPPVFTRMYAERLNNSCLMEIKEAQDGDRVFAGRALVAPGDYHMRIKKKGSIYFVECRKGEKVNGHCPSVDVLFDSVAEQIGRTALGVILTGMGTDGAKGLLAMKKIGAKTIGQDEESCIVYGMPRAALNLGAVDRQVPLVSIPQVVCSMIRGK
ncbi:MAG: chemotaxis response regulator protein-glutamate methylesterase [Firmicutes bacterium HGW-Firmicutes-15]|nr:MAG: chemotaxis response regulator protein-glutamate methylesterase [Firmicutes bacterium HGW-Firmicutes-15]